MRDAARDAQIADPIGYMHTAEVKFFRTVADLVLKEIPTNPDHPAFRQGRASVVPTRIGGARSFIDDFDCSSGFTPLHHDLLPMAERRESCGRPEVRPIRMPLFYRILGRGTPPSDWDALVRACEAMSGEE